MKKVVHLITLLELGGAQGNTIHTVQSLPPSKFETFLWCGRGAYWDSEMKERLGQGARLSFFSHLVRDIHPIYDLLVIWDLVRELKKLRPSILHTHSSKAGIVGRLAGKLAGVPTIIHTFHGFGFNKQQHPWVRFIYVLLEKWAAKWSTALIFVSEANRAEAGTLNIGAAHQYHLIRSGIPLKQLRKISQEEVAVKYKTELQIPMNDKIIITISAFKPQKNLTDFVEMAARIAELEKNVTFVIIGDGEQRNMLNKRIQDKNLTSRFRMLGWRTDASMIMAASDIFVLTSLWEGLPRALVEALVLGKPAVCYETDGVMDILPKGGGVVVKQKDVVILADQILSLLKNKDLYQTLSQQAKNLITDDFDIDEMVNQQEQLYDQLNHS